MNIFFLPRFLGMRVIVGLFNILICLTLVESIQANNSKLSFWDVQRKGANGDANAKPEEWFRAVVDAGIEFIRLSPTTWPAAKRDFLIGDADEYQGIPEPDFQKLKSILDVAQHYKCKIVLTMFSLPGARWRQQNGYEFDYRLWTEERYQEQALTFWRDLADRLKDHPSIVGYNPFNEPYPARRDGFEGEEMEGFSEWLAKNKGTPVDLNHFNRRMVEAIRSVDPDTPIVLDCWFHSSPKGFDYFDTVDDQAVLYAFHYYDPWNFNTYRVNKERFSYPDRMPVGWTDETEAWTIDHLHQRIDPVLSWMKRNGIESNRVVAEEFGCDRRVVGAREYLRDLMQIFNEHHWHWAFYSFRSSDWDGMDYELGTEKLDWRYWDKREQGADHETLIHRHDNPLWDIFKVQFSMKKTSEPN